MDWEGQKAAEALLTRVLLAFGGAGFLLGYLLQNFRLMVGVYTAGGVLALALVVPEWPFLNKAPLQWLPPLNPPGAAGFAGDDPAAAGSVGGGGRGGGADADAQQALLASTERRAGSRRRA
jgi:signal peptidase complex subunit 1